VTWWCVVYIFVSPFRSTCYCFSIIMDLQAHKTLWRVWSFRCIPNQSFSSVPKLKKRNSFVSALNSLFSDISNANMNFKVRLSEIHKNLVNLTTSLATQDSVSYVYGAFIIYILNWWSKIVSLVFAWYVKYNLVEVVLVCNRYLGNKEQLCWVYLSVWYSSLKKTSL